jgi:hypothetical protein
MDALATNQKKVAELLENRGAHKSIKFINMLTQQTRDGWNSL